MATVLTLRPTEAAEAADHAESAVARRGRRWTGAVLLAVLLLATGLLHGWNMYQSPGTTVTDDEGTYVAQAWALLHLGQLADYTYWYDHPPVGWMLLAAAGVAAVVRHVRGHRSWAKTEHVGAHRGAAPEPVGAVN